MAGHTTGTEVPVQPEWQTHTQPDGSTTVPPKPQDQEPKKQSDNSDKGVAVQGPQDF